MRGAFRLWKSLWNFQNRRPKICDWVKDQKGLLQIESQISPRQGEWEWKRCPYKEISGAFKDTSDLEVRPNFIVSNLNNSSDKQKRELYIETGEIDDDGPGFDENTDLMDYWRQIYPKITLDQIKKFTEEYQGSDEERTDLLDAYKKHKGKMGKIMEEIPASTLEDEDRFVKILKQAIKDKEVKSYKAFTNESAASKRERREAALEEHDEAEQHAKDLGIDLSKTKDTDDLAAMILSKNKARGSFLGKWIVF